MSIRKILVANRGEIAVRVIRACRELRIGSVAVYSDADRTALHVRDADEAYAIGPAPSSESYLKIGAVIDAARRSGADAVHPGYGFLAENAAFAAACADAGLTFIGPKAETIELMGEKTSARRVAVDAGVPVVPGTLHPLDDDAAVIAEAQRIGFPVILKAAAGGGGKGLRLVRTAAEVAASAARARSEAQNAFGDGRLYVERAILEPRHIEIQLLADHHGNVVHLFERECSIQRRHQKVIEESPSPAAFMTPELRRRMGEMAVALGRRAGYRNAGTLEFLVDAEGHPYFLEMNTRLQVEHPVTELVTGLDLVKLQIHIAGGEALPFVQDQLSQRGHAIECRVYAEDPDAGFLPSPGTILGLRVPAGPGIRDDSGVYEGYTVPIHYDPLISKLVAYGASRTEAVERMRRAVSEYRVLGIRTTLSFFDRVLRDPRFLEGRFDTSFIERFLADKGIPTEDDGEAVAASVAAALAAYREKMYPRNAPQSSMGPSAWWKAGVFSRLEGRR